LDIQIGGNNILEVLSIEYFKVDQCQKQHNHLYGTKQFIGKKDYVIKGYNFTLPIRGSGFLENRLPWRIDGWLIDDEISNTFKKVE